METVVRAHIAGCLHRAESMRELANAPSLQNNTIPYLPIRQRDVNQEQ